MDRRQKIDLIGRGSAMELISSIRRLDRARQLEKEKLKNLGRPDAEPEIRVTRSTVARASGFTVPTVSRALDPVRNGGAGLIEHQVVKDDNGALSLDKKFGYFLGIYVGSRIRVSVCNFIMENLSASALDELAAAPEELPGIFSVTKEKWKEINGNQVIILDYTSSDMVSKINKIIKGLLELKVKPIGKELELLGVGISTPSVIDYEANSRLNTFDFCPNVEALRGQYTHFFIYKETYTAAVDRGVKICLEHDTEAGLVHQREMLFRRCHSPHRAAWGYDNIALVYQGSGTGAAFILNGKLYRGRGGAAGEVGGLQEPLIPEAFRYDETKLENFLDETNHTVEDIRKYINEKLGDRLLTVEEAIRIYVFNAMDLRNYLNKITFTSKDENGKTIKDENGEPIYPVMEDFKKMEHRRELFLQYLQYISGTLINLLSMDVIIFGGPVFDRIGGDIVVELSRRKPRYAIPNLARDTQIIKSEVAAQSDDMIAVGTAYVALYNCHENNRVFVTDYSGQEKPVCIDWPGSVN